MPITFAPPQPFAPAIAQGAGAAQVEQQNTGTLAQLYEQAGRNRQAAAQAEADRFAQNARTGAALSSSDQQHADELQFRKDQFQASLNPHARDVFAAQVGEAHLRQHAELNAWVQQQDMTFADEQRLKNQQMAVSEVQRAWGDGEITDQDRNDLLTQLRTHIDPAKQRQERALAEQEQAHAKAYAEQAARQSQVQLSNAKLDAMTIQDRIRTVPHPEVTAQIAAEHPDWTQQQVEAEAVRQGGSTQWIIAGFDQYGHAQWKQVEHQKTGKAQAAAETELVRQKDYETAVQRAERSVERWAAQRDKKDAEMAQKNNRPPEPLTAEEYHQNVLDELAKFGLEPTWEQQRAKLAARGGVAAQGNGPGSGQIPPQGKAEAKPFGPDEDASPDQLHQVNELARQRDVVEKLPIPPGLKSQFTAATYVMDAMLRKYGTLSQSVYDRMSDDDKKNYAWARTSIDQVSRVGFQGQQQPAAPQAPAPMAGGRFPF